MFGERQQLPQEQEPTYSEQLQTTLAKERSLLNRFSGMAKKATEVCMLASALAASTPVEAQARTPERIESRHDLHEKRGEYNFSDDHNWALYGWTKDAMEGKIPKQDNTIIHIDSHWDMGYEKTPYISKEFLKIWNDPKATPEQKTKAMEKEAGETSKENFILKAVALGMSKEVYWVRPDWDKPAGTVKRYRLHKEEHPLGKKIGLRLEEVTDTSSVPGDQLVTVHEIGAQNIPEAAAQAKSLIVDVDLDYLSCGGQGAPEFVPTTDLDALHIKYDASTVQDGKVRNPLVNVHRSPENEIVERIGVLKKTIAELPKKPTSFSAALEPDYLFPDQVQLIEKEFFKE